MSKDARQCAADARDRRFLISSDLRKCLILNDDTDPVNWSRSVKLFVAAHVADLLLAMDSEEAKREFYTRVVTQKNLGEALLLGKEYSNEK